MFTQCNYFKESHLKNMIKKTKNKRMEMNTANKTKMKLQNY